MARGNEVALGTNKATTVLETMSPLNVDVLCHILENTTISGIAGTASALMPGISDSDIERCEYARINPITYMKQLTKHSENLLRVMTTLGVILSGSRAANYFYPGLCTKDSDWDFYCDSDVNTVVRFSTYMNRIGVQWDMLPRGGNRRGYDKCNVLRGTHSEDGVTQRVQFIWSMYGRKNAIPMIVSFHSSVVQCFITGYCAVSMYGPLLSKGQSLAWVQAKDHRTSARRKYAKRGIKYVSYDRYMKILDDAGDMRLHLVKPNQRTLRDDNSEIVHFSRYFPYSNSVNILKRLTDDVTWYDIGYVCKTEDKISIPRLAIALNMADHRGDVAETIDQSLWYVCDSIMHIPIAEVTPEVEYRAKSHVESIAPWLSESSIMYALCNKCLHAEKEVLPDTQES